jgi:hypothetical protein
MRWSGWLLIRPAAVNAPVATFILGASGSPTFAGLVCCQWPVPDAAAASQ